MSVGKGTTPRITYNLDVDISAFPVVWFTIKDSRGTMLNLTGDRLMFEAAEDGTYSVSVRLTQEETLSLTDGELRVQIRAKDSDGLAYKTGVAKTETSEVLKGGVI